MIFNSYLRSVNSIDVYNADNKSPNLITSLILLQSWMGNTSPVPHGSEVVEMLLISNHTENHLN